MKKKISSSLYVYQEKLAIMLIWLVAFLIRLGLLVVTDDFHGVSAGRILNAELIIKNNLPFMQYYIPVHPPLHVLLLTAVLKIFNAPFLAPRLISLFFGSFLIFPFYYYVKKVFDKKIAFFSIIAVAIYSQHIVYSIIATSEVIFHFFLFLSLGSCINFSASGKKGFLYLSALAIGLAGLCRYEGWAFIPVMAIFFRKNKTNLGIFLLVSLILPGSWMFINHLCGGDALLFLNTNNFNVPLQFNWIRSQGAKIDLLYKLLFWPRSLSATLGIPLFFAGITGVIYCLIKREKVFYAGMFLTLFLFFVFSTVQERLYLQPRYSVTLGLMLIPFAVFIILKLLGTINKKIPSYIVLLLLWTMIPAIGQRILAEPLYTPNFARDIAQYMKDHITEDDNIIIDHCGDEKYKEPIKLLSRINPRQFVMTPYLVVETNRWVADEEKLFYVLRENDVTILIYSPYGDLGNVLTLHEKGPLFVMRDFKFELQYENGPYFIYRLKKVDSNA